MHENGHVSCLELAGRASNDELRAWLAADASSDSHAFQRLFQAVTPLLYAYFEGKLPQRGEDLNALTLDTLLAVYLHRASYDPQQPFRAWLLSIARLSLTEYLHNGCAQQERGKVSRTLPDNRFDAISEMERETLHRLHGLARRHVDSLRNATGACTREGRRAIA